MQPTDTPSESRKATRKKPLSDSRKEKNVAESDHLVQTPVKVCSVTRLLRYTLIRLQGCHELQRFGHSSVFLRDTDLGDMAVSRRFK